MAFKPPILIPKEEAIKVVLEEVQNFLRSEQGNRVTPYNGAGMMNQIHDRLNRIEPVVIPAEVCATANAVADETNQ